MSDLVEAVHGLWVDGGSVMPALFGCTVLLWYALGLRLLTLRRGDSRSLHTMVVERREGRGRPPKGIVDRATADAVQRAIQYSHVPRAVIEEAIAAPRAQLEAGRKLIRTLVSVAPLAGLLGTVSGMIETFRSLADMALFTQGGGIAGGIAEALLTTQMGLAVAVPGIVIGRMLDRKQALYESELDQLVELLRSTPIQKVAA